MLKHFRYTQLLLLVSLLLVLNIQVNAQESIDYDKIPAVDFERTAKSGWQFLHIPTVARNAALANVSTGIENNDVMSLFYNPANLVDIEGVDVGFSQMKYIADIDYVTAAVAKNFGSWGVFGLHFASLNTGDMIRTENIQATNALGQSYNSRNLDLGTFDAGNMRIGLSYARAITDRIRLGTNISYIEERLDDVKVNNFDFDLGLYFRTGFQSLRFAIVARNLGTDQRFEDFDELYGLPVSVRMPMELFMGVGYDVLGGLTNPENQHRLTAYFEASHPNDANERVNAALEYDFMKMFSLRGGYRFNYDEIGLTAGAGANLEMAGYKLRIDYAYLDYGRLEQSHLFTIGFGLANF